MKIRGFFFVELETVFEHQSNVVPELCMVPVYVQVEFVEDCTEIHGLGDNFEVIRAVVPLRVDWLAEQDSVMDMVFGEVEQFRANHHQTFGPFAFDFVGLD